MRYKYACRESYAGFTLIELLVAISILAIVAVLGWRGLDSIARSREVLTSELEQTRGLQLTFAQLQSDCSQNVNPLSYPNIPEGRTSWIEPQRLILIRNDYADDEAPAMQVIVYRLQNANLTRFESIPTHDLAVLKQLLEQARNPPADQVEVVMEKNIQSIEFAGYLANVAASNLDLGNNDRPSDGSKNSTDNADKRLNDKDVKDKDPNSKDPNSKDLKAQPDASDGSGNIQKLNQNNVTTGLQVSLQLENHDNKIIKIFMLGGA